MLTKKEKIIALGKLTSSGKVECFAEALAYFLETLGYKIIIHSPSGCRQLILLQNELTNFPTIELYYKETAKHRVYIYIDKKIYTSKQFYFWLNKNFGVQL